MSSRNWSMNMRSRITSILVIMSSLPLEMLLVMGACLVATSNLQLSAVSRGVLSTMLSTDSRRVFMHTVFRSISSQVSRTRCTLSTISLRPGSYILSPPLNLSISWLLKPSWLQHDSLTALRSSSMLSRSSQNERQKGFNSFQIEMYFPSIPMNRGCLF